MIPYCLTVTSRLISVGRSPSELHPQTALNYLLTALWALRGLKPRSGAIPRLATPEPVLPPPNQSPDSSQFRRLLLYHTIYTLSSPKCGHRAMLIPTEKKFGVCFICPSPSISSLPCIHGCACNSCRLSGPLIW